MDTNFAMSPDSWEFKNQTLLQDLQGQFVAVDLDFGDVVATTPDSDQFEEQLRSLVAARRGGNLYTFFADSEASVESIKGPL